MIWMRVTPGGNTCRGPGLLSRQNHTVDSPGAKVRSMGRLKPMSGAHGQPVQLAGWGCDALSPSSFF
jgi:hypothetical protein